ncbi:Acyl-CoA carboxylase epsilon subunit [Amycolatopsis pretoriensis]|uniref:Acyl-CoA carboxylase epsilon subunit n=1 Tax=Amycolatopsis pretoriensis TaxID=218821 RepID=A0A1H5RDB5_9PSEU|nr:acyl-CoA carboxylase epsilon subunit [Amycolatopsis pretoriensis]SEF36360.1 Acyl-CoA carboxylase epsilon subunit [Amycolatopsis pretoriensis]
MDGPVVRVVRGAPDETELAALVAVLAAAGATRPAAAEPAPVRLRRRVPFQPATSWRTSR